MIEPLRRIETLILNRCGLTTSAITADPESEACSGYNFQLGSRNINSEKQKAP